METVETYTQRRQNTVAQYIATRLLLDLYEVIERKQGTWLGIWWWDHVSIDLAEDREMAEEADEDGMEE